MPGSPSQMPEPSGMTRCALRPRAATTDFTESRRISEKAVDNASAVVASDAITETLKYRQLVSPVAGSKRWLKRPSRSNWVP